MIIEVEKKVKETVEVKTDAYYKRLTGFLYINEGGDIISVTGDQITVWYRKDKSHSERVQDFMNYATECTREEFTTAYHAALANIQAAVDGVVIS